MTKKKSVEFEKSLSLVRKRRVEFEESLSEVRKAESNLKKVYLKSEKQSRILSKSIISK